MKIYWNSTDNLPNIDVRVIFVVAHDSEAKADNVLYSGWFDGCSFWNDDHEGYKSDSYYDIENVTKWIYAKDIL